MSTKVFSFVEELANSLFGPAGEGGESIAERFASWLGGVLELVFNFGAGFVEGLHPFADQFARNLLDGLNDLFAPFNDALDEWFEKSIGQPLRSAWAKAWQGFVNIFTGEADDAPYLGGAAGRTGGLSGFFGNITAGIESIPKTIEGIKKSVGSAWDDVKKTFEEFVTAVIGEERDVKSGTTGTGILRLVQLVRDGISGALNEGRAFIESALAPIGDLFGTVLGTISSAIGGLISKANELINTLKTLLKLVTGGIGGFEGGEQPPGPAKGPRAPSGERPGQAGNVFTGSGDVAFTEPFVFGGGDEGKAAGGPGYGGRGYLIEPQAGPELFVPRTSGDFVPNIDRLLERAGTTINLTVMPQINPAAGPVEEQADIFSRRIERELSLQGI